jgi:ribosome recycling factor
MLDLTKYEEQMIKQVQNFKKELEKIRAGRANPNVFNKIYVDYYGASTPLNQIANINIPDAKSIIIQPWDISALKLIEKAILNSNLGFTPIIDGKVLRITLPELTEEHRIKLTKEVNKITESFRIRLRNIRHDAMSYFKAEQKSGTVTLDSLKSLEDKLQKLIDKYISDINKIADSKNKDIKTV